MEDGASKYLEFPVNPEEIEVSVAVDNEGYKTLNKGEVVLPGFAGLRRVHFSASLPAHSSPFDKVAELESYTKGKKVLRFIMTRYEMQTNRKKGSLNMKVLIENFSWLERGGEVGTVFFDLTLREYRTVSLKVIK